MSLSIHLLPEFGWSVRGQPVFGPGSVFQGHVELSLSQTLMMDRVRLVFQGQEALVPFHITPGVLRAKHTPLFAVQQTLWESKDGLRSLDADTYKFSFTVQMPQIQYPPTMDNETYKCSFKLIAVVEEQSSTGPSGYNTLFYSEESMLYMPFVETQLLKQPLVSKQQDSDLTLTTRLHALCYVPGDCILGSLTISSTSSSSSSSKKQLDVSLQVYQTITPLVFDDIPSSVRIVASTSKKLSPVYVSSSKSSSSSSSVTYSSSLELDLPDNLTPTFTYGALCSVTYRLVLTVKRKGPLGMWAQELTKEWPLTVGTLGAGVRSCSDLLVYCADSTTTEQLRPKFMKAVEYEDALPLYDSDRLPDYQAHTVISSVL
ncbi:uncharacterized protein BX664DRAFT_384376 [Halteromyces radiatus]|uniref:uncharacterized protein n=1 Tax=Halteromyces radiatus TaxID=101107 RepID=UPI002220D327|nr:uncharacterized protein BX664DRAFT_384376 [Halteromyces radiatus]KAI8092864.1 hypothetical protein BX664DRAFT_384376 [Halteromyces radiatus]